MDPNIYLSFRFHGNFYHSYRGDTNDEFGFGKDIRIIRHIIRTLDEFNRRGIPVQGTWDFENYFSLETLMPEYCPDLVADLQRRVKEGHDEVQIMSYNNGLINAHTAREFEESIRRAVTNPQGSGLLDLFPEGFYPMVRPQEMMYTPIHLKLYQALGVHAVSLYYSAVPFNGFSNFIPTLSTAERYNPLTLTYPGIDESMTLVPCYNIGDLADHITLRRWVKGMRKQQLAMQQPCDLLLVLDQDADDEIWLGTDQPLVRRFLSTLRGLEGLVGDVIDLPFIKFTTPGQYLDTHPPVGHVSFGQDTADGSFDGLSSWAEKWSNHQIFTGLERARILDLQTRRLFQGTHLSEEARQKLDQAFEYRLRLLSTTHFGMAAPLMNLRREQVGCDLAGQAVRLAFEAFQSACPSLPDRTFALVDFIRGESTSLVEYQPHPSRSLVRLGLSENAETGISLAAPDGAQVETALLQTGNKNELLFVESFSPLERKEYRFVSARHPAVENPVLVASDILENEHIRLKFNSTGQVISLTAEGREFSTSNLFDSAIHYGNQVYRINRWEQVESLSVGVAGLKRLHGLFTLPGGFQGTVERELLLAKGLPYLYVRTKVMYPSTPNRGYNRQVARRLQQAWDNRWKAVHPCEIRPNLGGSLRVWKHNFVDHISCFDLDYGKFSQNHELSNVNNQVTHAWVAVTDGQKGLLLAQNADLCSSVAFCPIRTSKQGVHLNPFGTYWGPQYRYSTADTHLGAFLAATLSAASHIKPYAPSYNGRIQEFSLLLAPYQGDCPPEQVRFDAEAFAYPYIVAGGSPFLEQPPHQSWEAPHPPPQG